VLNLLEESIDSYEWLANIYLQNENILKNLDRSLHILDERQKIELINAFLQCEKIRKECYNQAQIVKQCYDEAYSKLDTQRIFHNLFGGGAKDITAFLYYSSEGRLKKMSNRICFIQADIDLLKRVCACINSNVSSEVYAQMKANING
jgi:hypothetical protein